MPHNTSTMLPSLEVDLEEFDVSPNGFLPEELPLKRLSAQYYESWEAVIQRLPSLLGSRSLRGEVDKLRVLSTSRLSSMREWRRAYLILSFMTHSYIWEAGGPSEVKLSLLKLYQSKTSSGFIPC
jgi:indoleamine 2,3-dioxygenase